MRVLKVLCLAVVAASGLVQAAAANEGGLGFQPPAFFADPFQPDRVKPYGAVCLAPPAACGVHYEYPIRAGKPCWCRDGAFVYTGGVTQPLHPGRPVYKD
ncbi:hypothetical protein P7D22_04425 [Lichenihabitans sp. Uapishka_5]|uniref:hypothetical protein n=1 Tax=Lichenihabitans sp. Uapishka_5 TaxID=3037302 RepID=UPI0029E81324|nr:hypothetical protein [Lichenihabitans sp. Uapishka_5]MDX7950424.1 hypothetical protein [Lichenihabitans sp. Uapishka_5]